MQLSFICFFLCQRLSILQDQSVSAPCGPWTIYIYTYIWVCTYLLTYTHIHTSTQNTDMYACMPDNKKYWRNTCCLPSALDFLRAYIRRTIRSIILVMKNPSNASTSVLQAWLPWALRETPLWLHPPISPPIYRTSLRKLAVHNASIHPIWTSAASWWQV